MLTLILRVCVISFPTLFPPSPFYQVVCDFPQARRVFERCFELFTDEAAFGLPMFGGAGVVRAGILYTPHTPITPPPLYPDTSIHITGSSINP